MAAFDLQDQLMSAVAQRRQKAPKRSSSERSCSLNQFRLSSFLEMRKTKIWLRSRGARPQRTNLPHVRHVPSQADAGRVLTLAVGESERGNGCWHWLMTRFPAGLFWGDMIGDLGAPSTCSVWTFPPVMICTEWEVFWTTWKKQEIMIQRRRCFRIKFTLQNSFSNAFAFAMRRR